MTTMSAATAIALSDLRQQSGLPFRKAFSNSHLADVISRHVNDFRDRAYPPDLTLMAFCSQIISPNSSCRKAVVRINRDRSKNGLSRVSASTSLHGARDYDFRRGRRLGEGDHIVQLIKPPKPKWMDQQTYDQIPKTLKLREMRSEHRDGDGQEVIIVTTLLEPKEYPRTEVLGAYRLRWNVELDLRTLKSVMGMDVLSCKTPDMIEKEVWIYILAYNLIRQLICQAADRNKLEPRRISFTAAIQTFEEFLPLFDVDRPEFSQRMYDAMIDLIAQQKIPHRPGRSEPKAVKRRPKGYPLLMEPRNKLQKRVGS